MATPRALVRHAAHCAGGAQCRSHGTCWVPPSDGARRPGDSPDAGAAQTRRTCASSSRFQITRGLRLQGGVKAIRSGDPGRGSAAGEGGFDVWGNGGGIVHNTAGVHPSVVVLAGAIVSANASVHDGCVIHSGAVIGAGVIVGARTVVHANASLAHCVVGEDCILHMGCRIGADGFGFYVDEATGSMVKRPQELNVRIGSQVEIGANSCIDRGSWRDTDIGDGTKIDNLVQVGHNVRVGRCCILCGHVALGGSSSLGDYVVMAGKSAVADHVEVPSRVRVGAKSGVIKSITKESQDGPAGGDYAGFPAVEANLWRRQVAALKMLAKK
mmetsp:Transcript_9805/g.25067  ORF Transcript_9805/g.25067 Transcript_9805/m.25067 type:complete len:327 (-) Transcript_9805:6-986(-)